MSTSELNPFWVYAPEQVDADYIAKNFVDSFTDYPQLTALSNTFLLGVRGTGKSMLLRSLEPRVMLKTKKALSLEGLPYVGVHIPLRRQDFNFPELGRFKGYLRYALGEHLLTMYCMFHIVSLLLDFANDVAIQDSAQLSRQFFRLFVNNGGSFPAGTNLDEPLNTSESSGTQRTDSSASSVSIFRTMLEVCEEEILRTKLFYKRSPYETSESSYEGALTGFLDFIIPFVRRLHQAKLFSSVPVFLMLDDADNLPRHMQRIINSWVSSRSMADVCLKISTQLGYATYLTVDNRLIEAPHDFEEVNLTSIYTSDADRYTNKVREVIERRLLNAGIVINPEDFFPPDREQQKRLEEIKLDIRDNRPERDGTLARPGASRSRDDVLRQAIPRLMRELAGSSRSSHTYSYAGFRSLVDLSSGVLRWFLEPANRMYDEMVSRGQPPVQGIPVAVQDRIIKDWSKEFMDKLVRAPHHKVQEEVDFSAEDLSLHATGHYTEQYDQLRNLIEGLGRLFRKRLLDSEASEQRVFSIMVSGRAPESLDEVFDLGVRLGYLQRADNAAKEPFGGRRTRYILSRRLGPYFHIDVSGYAAHLSVTPDHLQTALRDPTAFVSARTRRSEEDVRQPGLELGGSEDA